MAETNLRVANVDPVWTHIREEARAAVGEEPLLDQFAVEVRDSDTSPIVTMLH